MDHSSTQDEHETTLEMQVEEQDELERLDSPEPPVVISARRVRKRNGRVEATQTSVISKVKIEEITSSPLGLAAFHDLAPGDSFDLDEIGEKQDTPQKRKAELARRKQSKLQEVKRDQAAASSRTPSSKFAPAVCSALRPLSTNKKSLPRTTDERAPKRRRITSDLAIDELAEDGENSPTLQKGCQKVHSPEFASRLNNLLVQPGPSKQLLNAGRTRLSSAYNCF